MRHGTTGSGITLLLYLIVRLSLSPAEHSLKSFAHGACVAGERLAVLDADDEGDAEGAADGEDECEGDADLVDGLGHDSVGAEMFLNAIGRYVLLRSVTFMSAMSSSWWFGVGGRE